MPDTGLEPTMAIALAATVVKRKAIAVTTSHATRACQKVLITPIQKNISTAVSASAMKKHDVFHRNIRLPAHGFAVRCIATKVRVRRRPTAPRMIDHDFTMPMMPAIAMPPIPIMRAWSENMASGLMAAISADPYVPRSGIRIHHTKD